MCKNIYKCPICGNMDLEWSAVARWNIKKQEFEYDFIDEVMCWECGESIDPVEEVWDSDNV